MTKNYTFNEAVHILHAGTDKEAIADIARRYPLLAIKITQVLAYSGNAFAELAECIPDYVTANKCNAKFKGAAKTEETEEPAAEETEEPKGVHEATEDEDMPDYGKMNANKLIEIIKSAKGEKPKSLKKADLVAECEAIWKAKNSGEAEESFESEEETEDEEKNPYEGKSAMELYKLCKEKGIKAEPKKPAKYYVDLLTKNDEENSSEDDEDWGNEDEEDEKPKSKTKKKAKDEKPKPKKKAKDEDDSDEDDDWDI